MHAVVEYSYITKTCSVNASMMFCTGGNYCTYEIINGFMYYGCVMERKWLVSNLRSINYSISTCLRTFSAFPSTFWKTILGHQELLGPTHDMYTIYIRFSFRWYSNGVSHEIGHFSDGNILSCNFPCHFSGGFIGDWVELYRRTKFCGYSVAAMGLFCVM